MLEHKIGASPVNRCSSSIRVANSSSGAVGGEADDVVMGSVAGGVGDDRAVPDCRGWAVRFCTSVISWDVSRVVCSC